MKEIDYRFLDLILKFWIMVALMTMCSRMDAQAWKDTNRGLYPNALQATINAKNHALGVKFDHLFEKPLLGVPIGLYGSFSRTIRPNLYYNNYRWENKYSIGFDVTLPKEHPEIRHIVSCGLVYNQHPGMWMNEGLPEGQSYAGFKETNLLGLDIGWRAQVNRVTIGFQIDAVNFFQYAQMSIGYAFYRIR